MKPRSRGLSRPLGAAVFASGGGTGLQSLLDHQDSDPPWRIRLVVSNREDAGALARASTHGVPGLVIPTRGREADEIARETLAALDEHGVSLIMLAGYLRLLPERVVNAFAGRVLNIHPALLPSFGGRGMYGMNVHEAVIRSGARISGPTVHLVNTEYDEGSILAQWPVPVLPGDCARDLAARVLRAEHRLYPLVADHVCDAILSGTQPGPFAAEGDMFLLASDATPHP